jgi:hypothetical protein
VEYELMHAPKDGAVFHEERKLKNPILMVGESAQSAINISNLRKFMVDQIWTEPMKENTSHVSIQHYHITTD